MHTFLLAGLGGVLIGLSAVLLMASIGRIAGISGIAQGVFSGSPGDRGWRAAFIVGLIVAPLLMIAGGDAPIGAPVVGLPLMALAGLLVGFGTRLSNGCTSGHGVCGTSRLSRRSLLATVVFMVSGAATVLVMRHLLGIG